jgi:hypothetical protein
MIAATVATPRKNNPDQDYSKRDQHPILTEDAESHKIPDKPIAHRSPTERKARVTR